MKAEVKLTSGAKKDLKGLAKNISESFQVWVKAVIRLGLSEASKGKGYNLENLKGKRQHQMSVRLSRGYRVIFTVRGGEIEVVTVEEVNNHKY